MPFLFDILYNDIRYNELNVQTLSAAENGDLKAFKENREQVSVNSRTLLRNDTALHLASREGHLHIVGEIFREDRDRENSCKNPKNRWDDTPLHEAAREGHLDIVEFLLEKEVDINAVNKKGHTALHEAVSRGYKEIVIRLCEKDVEINAVTKESKCTALHKATKKGDAGIVAVLLGKRESAVTSDTFRRRASVRYHVVDNEHGGTIGRRASAMSSAAPDEPIVLRERQASVMYRLATDVNIGDRDGRTPLHYACSNEGNALDCVKLLLEAKDIRLDMLDKDGLTPLHVAASEGSRAICEHLLTKLRQCNKEQDVDCQCKVGRTALHYAVLNSNVEVVKILLQFNADRDLTDKKGKSPLDYARSSHSIHIVNVLEKTEAVSAMFQPQDAALAANEATI